MCISEYEIQSAFLILKVTYPQCSIHLADIFLHPDGRSYQLGLLCYFIPDRCLFYVYFMLVY